MTSAGVHEDDLPKFTDLIHPNLMWSIYCYKKDNYHVFPTYHGCNYKNKNCTRKRIDYKRGEQCIRPIDIPYWRKTKEKYKNKGKVYFTRRHKNQLKWAKNMFIIHALA